MFSILCTKLTEISREQINQNRPFVKILSYTYRKGILSQLHIIPLDPASSNGVHEMSCLSKY